MKHKLKYIILVFGIIMMPTAASASATPLAQFAGCTAGTSFFGFPSWDACLERDNTNRPVIKSLNDIWKIVFPIVESMIRATGYIAVGFIIFGGIKYVKSQGDPGATGSAQKTIINALIGLIICILSVAIVQFVAARF